MRVLFIEDHEALAQAIGGALRRAGFAVDQVGTLLEAREALALAEYDLALLDVGLPDGSGTDLIPDLREKHATPVILLTARGALGDRIEGLNSGADDYVVKPVEIPELIARCRAVLRRPGNRTSAILTAGHLLLDTVHREARRGTEVLGFSRRELGVLELLMRRKNRVVPRQLLLETIYDRDEEVSPNAIDAAVSRVRRALGTESGVDLQTVRGVGWMLMDASDP
ncbi:response regulator transcription factor [Pseudoxanthobacter sp. M-2]|uniref:response regulator transcription factor n=1 Tax=Pseudoxanthobacter sp. M-2 TaxID=3078754 RepID=UPI0038FD3DED